MANRHRNKKRVQAQQSSAQGKGQGPQGPTWPTDFRNVSISDLIDANRIAPKEGGGSGTQSGYEASRGNACTHGARSKSVFPNEVADMIDERTRQFTIDYQPQNGILRWLVSEIARTTVQVDLCAQRLLQDEIRIINRVSGPGWSDDANARAELHAAHLPRQPYRTARALERSKQGAELLVYHFKGLADTVRCNDGLDDTQRSLLFDLVSAPLPLRSGTYRVPAGNDGPALLAFINKEVGRLEASLTETLNQRDRYDQMLAIATPSTYLDETRRRLLSDEARALKRLLWAKDTYAKLRKGTAATSIIDPDTGRPLDPTKDAPRAAGRASAAAPPPPSGADQEAPPPPAENLPPFPPGCSDEDKESLLVMAGTMAPLLATLRARMAAAGQASAEPDRPRPRPARWPPSPNPLRRPRSERGSRDILTGTLPPWYRCAHAGRISRSYKDERVLGQVQRDRSCGVRPVLRPRS